MSRSIQHSPGNWYHIYNRGVDKRILFNDNSDYDRFIKFLYLHNNSKNVNFRDVIIKAEIDAFDVEKDRELVDIVSWVLMPNHFHLLVFIPENAKLDSLAKFMQKLGTAYTMYFNKRNDRNGVLFQGPFKSKLIDTESYLMYLLAYIHLNPVKLIQSNWKEVGVQNTKHIADFLEQYEYSSLKDFSEDTTRKYSKVINKSMFPSGTCNPDSLKKDMYNWITDFQP